MRRHGPATWTVDVFDGLRRSQACVAGPQNATVANGAAKATLACTLRGIRSWATPWSNDPLPGTYYVRLSAIGLPEQDLGLPVRTDLWITARDGDAQPANARLKAPLSPGASPGATLAPEATPSASPSASGSPLGAAECAGGWFSWPSGRWLWTVGGGALAALAGVGGYTLTRHPRRWFSGSG